MGTKAKYLDFLQTDKKLTREEAVKQFLAELDALIAQGYTRQQLREAFNLTAPQLNYYLHNYGRKTTQKTRHGLYAKIKEKLQPPSLPLSQTPIDQRRRIECVSKQEQEQLKEALVKIAAKEVKLYELKAKIIRKLGERGNG